MDEGHKIKNEDALVSKAMQLVKSEGRLILTGTPLQNNLHELWALLRYVPFSVLRCQPLSGRSEGRDGLNSNFVVRAICLCRAC
jgi:SNF2 family DNA or RNA helicase